jgi:hypothetical protein
MLVEILANDTLIGVSNLDRLDPPMGVAIGDLAITKVYDKNQHAFLIDDDGSPDRGIGLKLRSIDHDTISYAELSIHDVSSILGKIQITVFGIPYPEYEIYFSQHPHYREYWGLD